MMCRIGEHKRRFGHISVPDGWVKAMFFGQTHGVKHVADATVVGGEHKLQALGRVGDFRFQLTVEVGEETDGGAD